MPVMHQIQALFGKQAGQGPDEWALKITGMHHACTCCRSAASPMPCSFNDCPPGARCRVVKLSATGHCIPTRTSPEVPVKMNRRSALALEGTCESMLRVAFCISPLSMPCQAASTQELVGSTFQPLLMIPLNSREASSIGQRKYGTPSTQAAIVFGTGLSAWLPGYCDPILPTTDFGRRLPDKAA